MTESVKTSDLTALPPARKDGSPADCYALSCSSVTSANLSAFLGREDIAYIDVRTTEEYASGHLKGFRLVPYTTFVYGGDGAVNLDRLYAGSAERPQPVFLESDEKLAELIPKDRPVFLICRSGNRVEGMMKLLAERGWDMSLIYNVGGVSQLDRNEYSSEMSNEPAKTADETAFSFAGLTPAKP